MRPERPEEASSPAPRERQLKVIGRQPLAAAFEAALARSLRRHLPELDERRIALVREQAFRDFMQLVGQKVRNLRGVSKRDFLAELERSHTEVLQQREEARRELARLQLRVEVIQRLKRDQGALDAGGSPLNEGLQELFRRAQRGELSLEDLKQEVELVAQEFAHLDKERSLSEYDRQLDVFERRIAKLNVSLRQSEDTIQELARHKAVDPGIASVYRTVQGLSVDDQQRDVKHDLLVKLFEANLALREQMSGGEGEPLAPAAARPGPRRPKRSPG